MEAHLLLAETALVGGDGGGNGAVGELCLLCVEQGVEALARGRRGVGRVAGVDVVAPVARVEAPVAGAALARGAVRVEREAVRRQAAPALVAAHALGVGRRVGRALPHAAAAPEALVVHGQQVAERRRRRWVGHRLGGLRSRAVQGRTTTRRLLLLTCFWPSPCPDDGAAPPRGSLGAPSSPDAPGGSEQALRVLVLLDGDMAEVVDTLESSVSNGKAPLAAVAAARSTRRCSSR